MNEGSLNVITFEYYCLDSFWHGTHYFFSDIDTVTATFYVLVNTYFLNFRTALLIVLRALAHLIYLVIFNNFLVLTFFFYWTIICFSLDKYSIIIFDAVLHHHLNVVKFLKWSSTTTGLSWFWSMMQNIFTFFPSFVLSRTFPEQVKPFINSFKSYLFCYKCWLNYFLAIE